MIDLKINCKPERLPIKATSGSACYDIFADVITPFDENGRELDFKDVFLEYEKPTLYEIRTGIRLNIPAGYKVVICPRSSITKSIWTLQNSPAQIDSDYRGEIILKFRHIGKDGYDFPYKVGDRVAQMYLEKVIDINFEIVDNIKEDTERGSGGFGSTGK